LRDRGESRPVQETSHLAGVTNLRGAIVKLPPRLKCEVKQQDFALSVRRALQAEGMRSGVQARSWTGTGTTRTSTSSRRHGGRCTSLRSSLTRTRSMVEPSAQRVCLGSSAYWQPAWCAVVVCLQGCDISYTARGAQQRCCFATQSHKCICDAFIGHACHNRSDISASCTNHRIAELVSHVCQNAVNARKTGSTW